MTMISSYYAQVGVSVNESSLRQVKNLLSGIESRISRFQSFVNKGLNVSLKLDLNKSSVSNIQRQLNSIGKSMTLKIENVQLGKGATKKTSSLLKSKSMVGKAGYHDASNFVIKARVNPASLSLVRREFNQLAKSLVLHIDKIVVSKRGLGKAMRDATKDASGISNSIRINATISKGSLNLIRSQLNDVAKDLNIGIRARKTNGTFSNSGSGGSGRGSNGVTTRDPSAKRTSSPWHNPMMLGGAGGAFVRYGAFSLPFVGGVMGLNAMANTGAQLEQDQMRLNVASQSRDVGASQMAYLSNLGDKLGRTTSGLVPAYAQMAAGVRGTAMESTLNQGFESFQMYGATTGLNEDQMSRATKAISQMIAKRSVMSEELRGQLAEAGMPMAVQFMADAVAGGDIKVLQDMMQKGAVDPIEALPKFFAALRREAEPFMNDYYKSITRAQGSLKKTNEDFMKEFMGGGGTEGLRNFFMGFADVMRDSIPYASKLGDIFKRIAYVGVGIIKIPGEMAKWFSGSANDKNFMQMIFGDVHDSNLAQSMINLVDKLSVALGSIFQFFKTDLRIVVDIFGVLGDIMSRIINLIADAVSLLPATAGGGQEIRNQLKRNENYRDAKQNTDNYLNQQGVDRRNVDYYGMIDTEARRLNRERGVPDKYVAPPKQTPNVPYTEGYQWNMGWQRNDTPFTYAARNVGNIAMEASKPVFRFTTDMSKSAESNNTLGGGMYNPLNQVIAFVDVAANRLESSVMGAIRGVSGMNSSIGNASMPSNAIGTSMSPMVVMIKSEPIEVKHSGKVDADIEEISNVVNEGIKNMNTQIINGLGSGMFGVSTIK